MYIICIFQKKAVALFDFNPQEQGELTLKKGDQVVIDDEVDKHWWSGKNCRTKECGLFPSNYIKCL